MDEDEWERAPFFDPEVRPTRTPMHINNSHRTDVEAFRKFFHGSSNLGESTATTKCSHCGKVLLIEDTVRNFSIGGLS